MTYAHDEANELTASFRRLAKRSRLEALREAWDVAALYHYGAELDVWRAAIGMLIELESGRVREAA